MSGVISTIQFNVATGDGENPATKGSARAMVFGGRPRIFNDNPKNKKWAERIGWIAKANQASDSPWSGPVEITLAFRMRKPKSMPKGRVLPTTKPDLDKMIRSVKDAHTGILYVDDAQIICLSATKVYGDEPGVAICLTNKTANTEI